MNLYVLIDIGRYSQDLEKLQLISSSSYISRIIDLLEIDKYCEHANWQPVCPHFLTLKENFGYSYTKKVNQYLWVKYLLNDLVDIVKTCTFNNYEVFIEAVRHKNFNLMKQALIKGDNSISYLNAGLTVACVDEDQDIIQYFIKLGATECGFCLDDYHRGVRDLPPELIGWCGDHDFLV